MQQALRRSSLVPAGFVVESAFCEVDKTVITVRAVRSFSVCPSCGTVSRRVHSRYQRRATDLPLSGRPVQLIVIARRFRCDAVLCGRQIFTERFVDGVLAASARRTARLDGIVHHLGLATAHGLPENAAASGLMAYGTDILDLCRRAAEIVDKILRGAKPADIPVEQSTTFKYVINLKTAKALGLTVPYSQQLLADEVIERKLILLHCICRRLPHFGHWRASRGFVRTDMLRKAGRPAMTTRLRIGMLACLAASAALALPTRAVALTQQQIDQCVNKGNVYSPDINIEACAAVIQSGRWSGNELAWAYTGRGNAYQAKGDYDRAIADYNQAISLDPKDASAYNNRGSAYNANGDYDRAIADLNQAISLDSINTSAYINRGKAYDAKGDYDRAIADFNQAISLDLKHASAYYCRGKAYDAKGDHDRAIADYSQAISLDPTNASAYFKRGNAYQAKGDYDRAIADYNQEISLDPKFASAYISRGDAYGAKKDLDRAIADFNQAIWLDPKNASAYYNRGKAYGAKKDLDRAIADYNQAISLDPKLAWAYGNRGNAYQARGDYFRAIADYNQAIALDPKNAGCGGAHAARLAATRARRSSIPAGADRISAFCHSRSTASSVRASPLGDATS